MQVAVVTDSTAYFPEGMAAGRGIKVVPLTVRVGERIGLDGVDIGPNELTAALARRHVQVSTSRPGPGAFTACYRQALAKGASEVVSIHISRELSGTWDAAVCAAEEIGPDKVRVVDSRSTAMGLGYAALAAADAAEAGRGGSEVEQAAVGVAARTRLFFCVETLEHLRRGGRIGAAAAFLGTALAMKPLLHVAEGRIVPLEKVRTTARAAARLVELAAQAAQAARGGIADVAVHHLGAAARATELAGRLRARLPAVRRCVISEVGAAIGAHVGPGVLGVVVVPVVEAIAAGSGRRSG